MDIVVADAKCAIAVDAVQIKVNILIIGILISIQFSGLPSSVLYEGAPTIRLAHPGSYEQETVVDCYRLPEQPPQQPLLGNFSSKSSTNANQKNKSGLENGGHNPPLSNYY
jgi:hypothetical protein